MKQTVKYIHIMVAVLVAAFAAGCTKDFDKINTDPTKINFGNIKASNMFEPIFSRRVRETSIIPGYGAMSLFR